MYGTASITLMWEGYTSDWSSNALVWVLLLEETLIGCPLPAVSSGSTFPTESTFPLEWKDLIRHSFELLWRKQGSNEDEALSPESVQLERGVSTQEREKDELCSTVIRERANITLFTFSSVGAFPLENKKCFSNTRQRVQGSFVLFCT